MQRSDRLDIGIASDFSSVLHPAHGWIIGRTSGTGASDEPLWRDEWVARPATGTRRAAAQVREAAAAGETVSRPVVAPDQWDEQAECTCQDVCDLDHEND
jgi:hypothetical protein